jgi:NhaP-type Na+/H+ or K+/H+ antiporter
VLYVFAFSGLIFALIFGITSVVDQRWYMLATATLLAFGLYGSTFGISIAEARRHLRLIVSAVTIGVLLKAIVIGTVMSLILRSAYGFILGVVVAQIDPLSTAALQKGKRLSKRAKTILAAWSSFDDPVTVILSLYMPIIIALLTGAHW